MGFLIGYLVLNLLPCALAVAAEGVLLTLARARQWRRWTGFLVPGICGAGGILLCAVWLLRDVSWSLGHTAGENTVTVLARLFICLVPCFTALLTWAVARTPAVVKVLLILLLIGIIPVSAMANDGGSVKHVALLYSVTFYHQIDDTQPGGYRTDTEVRLKPFFL